MQSTNGFLNLPIKKFTIYAHGAIAVYAALHDSPTFRLPANSNLITISTIGELLYIKEPAVAALNHIFSQHKLFKNDYMSHDKEKDVTMIEKIKVQENPVNKYSNNILF